MVKTLKMPTVSAIVARSEPGKFIGVDNQLPWHLKTDLQLFKKMTSDHVIIMGRKTYESIGHPLPNRINIVLSRKETSVQEDNLIFVKDPETALLLADKLTFWLDKSTFYVVGGGQVYNLFEQFLSDVFVTMVYAPDIKGDAVFDWDFTSKDWKTEIEDEYPVSDGDDYSFRFCKFSRKEQVIRNRQISALMPHDGNINEWLDNQKVGKKNLDTPISKGVLLPEFGQLIPV